MSAHTCVNMHLDRHQPSRRLALVTHGSDDRTIMNKYKTASHTTRLSVCGTRRTQMVTVCPARLAIAIYTRVMITSDVVGHAVRDSSRQVWGGEVGHMKNVEPS